ncbi:MAG TPA: ubiquitin-like small modifier protein 1 [Longimicrobiales bacterium]
MTARIHLPLALRPEAGGAEAIDVDARTVADALASVATRHPTIARHIFDETGALRRHVNVFVNQSELRTLDGFATPIDSGDEIHIVPSIAGG